jgi:hypothetical protein
MSAARTPQTAGRQPFSRPTAAAIFAPNCRRHFRADVRRQTAARLPPEHFRRGQIATRSATHCTARATAQATTHFNADK